jgi:hypothetical protein
MANGALQILEKRVKEAVQLIAKLKKENELLREARVLARAKVKQMLDQLKRMG